MADYAAKATDAALEALEKRIRSVYTQAQKDIEAKTKDFWERHATKDALYRQQVKDGKISAEDYQAWMRGQVFQGEQWKSKLQQVQATLAQANKEALNIINGGRIQVIATNLNWTAYSLEKAAGVNFGFGLYDSSAVTRLLRDDPDLLPAKKLNVSKDKLWNKGSINRQISQGIIQGEGLDKIAKRLRTVTDMNKNSSLTNARTMMTGAQNAGRQERYQEAKKKGIQLKKEWLATLDGHTRATHAALDGQAVETDQPFKIGGFSIMYPGDRNAPPAMVYGCRCTTVAKLEKYPDRYSQRYDNVTGKPIKDMTYKEWEKSKSQPKLEELHLSGIRSSIGDEYANAMETMLNFTEEVDVKDLFYKFGGSLKVTNPNMGGRGAYFDPSDGGVHMNASGVSSGDDVHVAYQTAFHEFAHNIDWVAGNERGAQWVSQSYKNGLLGSTIKSDFDEYAKRFITENPHILFQDEADLRVILRGMGRNMDEKFTTMARAQRRGEISIEEILGQYGDDISNYILSDYADRTWVYNEIIESLKSESMPMTTSGSLSDMLEYCTGNPYPLGVGHGKEYWGTRGYKDDGSVVFNDSGNAPLEFFAEVCDGKASNPKSLEQMRRVFPNAVKVVEDIIKEITK